MSSLGSLQSQAASLTAISTVSRRLVSNWAPLLEPQSDANLWGWSGAAPCPFQLWLSHACLSASSRVEGTICSRLALLWYSLNPLLFEQNLSCKFEPFCRKVLSLSLYLHFPPSLEIPQFMSCSLILFIRLSWGIQAQSLSLGLMMQPTPPCSAPAHGYMQASGLFICWQLQLGVYSVFCFVFVSFF